MGRNNKRTMSDLSTHEEIAEKFQELRGQVTQIANRLHDLGAEKAEHEAVLKALKDLDADRKCYRLVGEVLVERTVKEVVPAVSGNRDQMELIEGKLKQQLAGKRKELSEFQEKYKIRIRSAADVAEEQAGVASDPAKAQGVLV